MLLSTLAADFEEAEAADAPAEKQRPCSKPRGSIAVDRDVKWAKSTRIRSFLRFLGVRGHPQTCVFLLTRASWDSARNEGQTIRMASARECATVFKPGKSTARSAAEAASDGAESKKVCRAEASEEVCGIASREAGAGQ